MKLPKLDAITFKHIVGCIVLFLLCYIVRTLAVDEIPEGNREIFFHTLGIIEGAAMTVVTFYFGSSAGSKAKSKVLQEELQNEGTEKK